jgi:hypothetical protein
LRRRRVRRLRATIAERPAPDIFARRRLTVGQLRAVADRRFGDAEALVATGDNARANGAQYLAGIAVEVLLKGALVERYPGLAFRRQDEVTAADRVVWNLIWRSHDLAEMLERLPMLRASADLRGRQAGRPYLAWLTGICGSWTIFARYSPATSTMSDAREMVERVRYLKEVLR